MQDRSRSLLLRNLLDKTLKVVQLLSLDTRLIRPTFNGLSISQSDRLIVVGRTKGDTRLPDGRWYKARLQCFQRQINVPLPIV
jgi:hypothetical protein